MVEGWGGYTERSLEEIILIYQTLAGPFVKPGFKVGCEGFCGLVTGTTGGGMFSSLE